MSASELISLAKDKIDPTHILNRKNQKGQTLLYISCKYGNKRIVKALLTLGADPNIKSRNELPIQTAERWNHRSVFKLFLREQTYTQETLRLAFSGSDIRKESLKMIRFYYPRFAEAKMACLKIKCCF